MKKIFFEWLMLLSPLMGLSVTHSQLQYKEHFTITDGLAHNGVTDILEDSRGLIWISTYDGLNKYDGYNFTTYKNGVDSTVLVSNRIRTLNEDAGGRIWIGTDEGISIYDYNKERFLAIISNRLKNPLATGPIVRKILFDETEHSTLCLTESDGIYVFDDHAQQTGHHLPDIGSYDAGVDIYDGLRLRHGKYLLASSIGLLIFDIHQNSFKTVFEDKIKYVNAVLQVNDTSYIATLSSGIALLTGKDNGEGLTFSRQHILLKEYRFNSLSMDFEGNLWLGKLRDGIMKIKLKPLVSAHLVADLRTFDIEKSLIRTSSIHNSKRTGCWVGTFDRGVYRFDAHDNPFHYIHSQMNLPFGLQSDEIVQVAPYDKNRVFITAHRGGIALFNTKKGIYEPLPFQVKGNLLNISAVFVDSQKSIWYRQAGNGLMRVRKGSLSPEQITSSVIPDFKNVLPRKFAEDKYGNIWMGCINNIFRISLDDHGDITDIQSVNKNPFFLKHPVSLLREIYVDPQYDFIWVGTGADGLYRIDISKNRDLGTLQVSQYVHDERILTSVSSDFITRLVRLPNGELWAGTEQGGICKIIHSDKNPTFVTFSEKQGLSNNVVKGILYDKAYNLWISTNKGLNWFDTKDYTFRVFSKADRLPVEDFGYAATAMQNGYLLFGGVKGFCYFKPEELPNREPLPIVRFGDFKLFNRKILPDDTVDGNVILQHQLTNNSQISLNYDQNFFSIEVLSLHFAAPKSRYIKYRLVPVHYDWIEVSSSQKNIYFNDLPPGRYELRVMGSNSLHQWTKPQKLYISITPPFWATPLAYVFYALFTLLIFGLILIYVLRMNELRHKLQIEHIEKENEKQMNDARMRFFTNISHELRTPLTLISGPVKEWMSRFANDEKMSDQIKLVQRQAKKILHLVNQAHDFRKADANLLEMQFDQFCFDDLIEELKEDFLYLARDEAKEMNVEGGEKKIYVSADKDKLEKILNNLLNNAFKFTGKGDVITLRYAQESNNLILKISDTGCGIDQADLPHIFERFYRAKTTGNKQPGGSGIGLAFTRRLVEMHYGFIKVQSNKGQGTQFDITLPVVIDSLVQAEENIEKVLLEAEEGFFMTTPVQSDILPEDIQLLHDYNNAIIYLVEDNSDMRKYVEGLLVNFFEVVSFEDGQACAEVLKEEWPDLIVSDVMMPKINGFELCKAVKTDIKTSHIPVMLLTACTTIDDQIKGTQFGADAYLHKPFDAQHLITTIESLLHSRNQLQKRFQQDFPLSLHKEKIGASDRAFLEKLYALMEQNLDNEDLDINAFAKELYLNRTHFYQKVKALTSNTPFELLKIYRLKKAAYLLAQEKVSVNEAYLQTGFKSRTHFSRLFKEKYGVSPGKFTFQN